MFVRPLKYYVLLLPLAGNDYCKSTVEYMSCLLSSTLSLHTGGVPSFNILENWWKACWYNTGIQS